MSNFTETAQYCLYVIKKVCEPTWMKAYITVFSAIFFKIADFFYAEMYFDALVALFVLIIIDVVTALYRAHMTEFEIQSRKFMRTAFKIVIYFLLISAGHMADITLFGMRFVEGGLIGFLGATEMISILENFGQAGHAVPQKILNQLEEYRGESTGI